VCLEGGGDCGLEFLYALVTAGAAPAVHGREGGDVYVCFHECVIVVALAAAVEERVDRLARSIFSQSTIFFSFNLERDVPFSWPGHST
jgi:hypothetical protein